MPRSYSIVEPHPASSSGYFHTGIGGSGNVASSKNASSFRNASLVNPNHYKPQKAFSSGRGGAGNMHTSSERAIFSFDEELERQLLQEKDMAPVYHVGRGGAGNMVYAEGSTASQRRTSSGGSDRSVRTTTSVESGADAAKNKARRSLEKGWGKIAERF